MPFASLLMMMAAAQSQFTVTNASYSGPVERPADARLVWQDEFDGDRLDNLFLFSRISFFSHCSYLFCGAGSALSPTLTPLSARSFFSCASLVFTAKLSSTVTSWRLSASS